MTIPMLPLNTSADIPQLGLGTWPLDDAWVADAVSAAAVLGYRRSNIEEHDNIPGFREHDRWIDCDKCRAEWRFLEGRSVRDWGLEPVGLHSAV